jgi:hypothetical protein
MRRSAEPAPVRAGRSGGQEVDGKYGGQKDKELNRRASCGFQPHFTETDSFSYRAGRARGSGLGLPCRSIRTSVRSISTASNARIHSVSQTLTAHEFTARPEFSTAAPRAAGSDETIFAPDETVFACPRKRPETGSAQHRRDGQTMRFDHVRVPEPALSCVLQSPLARDAKTIFGQLAPRPSTPSRAPRSLECTAKLRLDPDSNCGAVRCPRPRLSGVAQQLILCEKNARTREGTSEPFSRLQIASPLAMICPDDSGEYAWRQTATARLPGTGPS